MEQEKLILIKKDAVIPLEIGAGFMNRIQQALLFFTDGKTNEELDAFNKALKDGAPLDGWMSHIETLLILIKGIEESAIDNNLTVEQDLPTA